jgi:hypothetical protein
MTSQKRSILYPTNKGLQLDLSAHALSKLLGRYEIFKRVLDLPGTSPIAVYTEVPRYLRGRI